MVWNTLPQTMKSINSQVAFKSKLTDFYTNKPLSQNTTQTTASVSTYPQWPPQTITFATNAQPASIANYRHSSHAIPFSSTANQSQIVFSSSASQHNYLSIHTCPPWAPNILDLAPSPRQFHDQCSRLSLFLSHLHHAPNRLCCQSTPIFRWSYNAAICI